MTFKLAKAARSAADLGPIYESGPFVNGLAAPDGGIFHHPCFLPRNFKSVLSTAEESRQRDCTHEAGTRPPPRPPLGIATGAD